MSIRFATLSVAAGLVAALGLLPWGWMVKAALAAGEPQPTLAMGVGHLVAGLAFAGAGAVASRGRVVRPWLAGPLAGFVAASLAAWLVWLPVVHATSLGPLWEVARSAEALDAEPSTVVGPATHALLLQGTLGYWAFAAFGAVAGLVGTALGRGGQLPHRGTVRAPILWPIRLWAWSAFLVTAGFVVLLQGEFEIVWREARGHGDLDPSQLFLVNGALLGLISAAPLGASLYRFARSARLTLRRLAFRGYGVVGVAGLLLWWAVPPLMARTLVGPLYAAYALAPLLGAAVGAFVVRRDPEAPVARASDVWWEMMPLAILTGPLVAGPGLGGVAWAALVGPLVWQPLVAGPVDRWPSVSATLGEVIMFPAAAWGLLVVVPMLEVLMVFLPVLIALRQGAVRQYVRRSEEVREAHTQPRMTAVSVDPGSDDKETELRTPPVTG